MTVNELFRICLDDVMGAGLRPGAIVSVTINTRAKKRWGQCKRLSDGTFTINISSRLLDDGVELQAAKNTMTHEILHTISGCFNHGDEWKCAAEIINTMYPEYNVKRTTSASEKGLEPVGRIRHEDYKIALVCTECQHRYFYKRECKATKNYTNYRCCFCKGKLEVIKI